MYILKNTAIHVFAINNSRILIDLFLFTLHTCIYDKNGNALSLGGKTINENVQVFKYCSVRHLKYLTNRRNTVMVYLSMVTEFAAQILNKAYLHFTCRKTKNFLMSF